MRNANLTNDQRWDAILRAVEAGDICGECFDWIPPDASVMVTSVSKEHVWELTGRWMHKQVVICLDCARKSFTYDLAEQYQCQGCGRELRQWQGRLTSRCCEACSHLAKLAHQKLTRRVHHDERRCECCGELFIPTRTDAVTCSSRCRQALYRSRKHPTAPARVRSPTDRSSAPQSTQKRRRRDDRVSGLSG